jgi:predicted esterase
MKNLSIVMVMLMLICSGISAQEKSESEGFDPGSIDPLKEDVGGFLDVDVAQYKRKAYELYNEQKYLDAAKYYLAALRFNTNDIISLYNLACCYGLLEEEELASRFLVRSVQAGYDNIDHIRSDPDFDKVRGKEVFDAAVDSIARGIEEKRKDLGNIAFTEAPIFLKCRIHLPEGYDPGKSYTLIVGLHGYGSNPDGFITLWKRFGEDSYIYASPQAPYPFPVGTDVGYSWGMWSDNYVISNTAAQLSEEYICEVVKSICINYNIKNVFLMGFSQGCAFTYRTGIKNHRLFKGLICFGGWLDKEWISENALKEARKLSVFIGHGKNDNSVEFKAGEDAFNTLKEHKYEVTFEDFEGGHAVPEEIMKKAIEWVGKENEKSASGE